MRSLTWAALSGPDLQERLPLLPGWPFGPVIRLERINAGVTNVNWRMTSGDEALFLKIPGAGTDAFIDRAAAHRAGVVAEAAGVGPPMRFFDADSGIEVTGYLLDHRPTRRREMYDPRFMRRLMAMYGRLHAGTALHHTKTLVQMIDEHVDQLGALGRPMPPYQRRALELWAPLQERYLAAGFDLVPGHNDMNPSNYMQGPDDSLRLIDFDYAANIDRHYEVGGLLAVYGYTGELRDEMIRAYAGEASAETRARVYISGIGALVKWGHWGLYNAALRDADYDYEKHGGGFLLGALTMMLDPECENAASAL